MNDKILTMLVVGDNILGPHAELFFTFASPVLNNSDVVVGQLEIPYTARVDTKDGVNRDPSNLNALVSAGFDVVTLAGNHITDAGETGIEDTITWLRENDISFTGAGMNIQEARQAAVIEREGTKFGFLSYNCVGPKETWAAPNKPGCAYVEVITHYELDHANPGGPPTIYTWAEQKSLMAMVDDIQKIRSLCDVLVVSLHKGLVHTPVKLAAYEKEISYAAIDAGADIILGQHAHILKGIELYKGKTIFHGLCNFVTFLPSLAPKPNQDPQSWAQRRIELFGFEPDPDYPTYPFHPEAKYTIIGKCLIKDKKIIRTSFIPCLINKQGQPEILKRDERGQEALNYMDKITRQANLNVKFAWEGDEVIIS
ncbi:MAG: CapA family protein [Clostridia bacterium]|jgi:poly-gamma-glutamate synthesis protein (capsule biosynthesis protein)|nr:CapA family protein [Clostridia bacterium]